MTVRFRPIRPEDTARLDAIMHTSSGYASPEMRALIETVHVDPAPREDYAGCLMEDADGLAGFYTLLRLDAGTCELDLFFLDNSRHGRGLGRTLFSHAADAARDMGACRLLIISNPAAEPFYLRMGARRTGTKPAGGRFGWDRPALELALS